MSEFAPLKGTTITANKTLTIGPSNARDQIIITNMNMKDSAVTVNISNGTDTFVLGSLATDGTLDGILPQTLSFDRKMTVVNGNASCKLDVGGYYEYSDHIKPDAEYYTEST